MFRNSFFNGGRFMVSSDLLILQLRLRHALRRRLFEVQLLALGERVVRGFWLLELHALRLVRTKV